ARLRSAAKPAAGWSAWGGAGMFRAGAGLSSPTLGWRAGDGLDGVLVGEALGVAVRAGVGELRLTLVVDGEETTRAVTVRVDEAEAGAWWGRSATVADATALMAGAGEGRCYARAGEGRVWSGARATAQWRRAVAAGRAATWWAHDADEARWVARAESDGAGVRVTVACATEAGLARWADATGSAPAVTRSSPWVDFG
ncbi:MAG: hypothetical protein JWM10_3182, partial [Myxococcaceae bacterium]|nr:hypothetical protein [Myxococcaceae bacterium]